MLTKIREKYTHIRAILEERVLLFSKRKKETKRAVKASSRAGILPEPYQVFITLEAEVNYAANLVATRTIDYLLSEMNELLRKQEKLSKNQEIFEWDQIAFSSYDEILSIFEIQIKRVKTIISNLSLDKDAIKCLTEIAFDQTPEDVRRKLVAKFVFRYLSSLLSLIFEELLIFDQPYIEQTAQATQKYLISRYNL